MRSLFYKGALYRESLFGLGHKKCGDGTHWNEKTKSCQKVSPELQSKMNAAHQASDRVKKEGGSPYVNHEKIQLDARDKHRAASDAAKAEGFHKLSKEHAQHATKHHDAYFKSLGKGAR